MTNEAPGLLPTAPNFRDLGGYRTRGGERVCSGVAYRSDALDRLDGPGRQVLRDLGIRQVIDLRTVFERETNADRLPEGADHVVLDVQGDHSTGADLVEVLTDPARAESVFGDGGADRFMHEVNRILVTGEDARAGYAEMVRRIAAGAGPTVIHCTAGKDRTGWAAALLLELLDVPRETVFADYLASNGRLGKLRAAMRGISERSGVDFGLIEPMVECRRSYLETAFAEVDDAFGSFEGYVTAGLGLEQPTIDALRGRMLDPA
ncbi:tyrosine-protein phosphatase [Streptomonospora sediminis]